MFLVRRRRREGKARAFDGISHMSMSAEANLPVCPKWILMNLPCWRHRRAFRAIGSKESLREEKPNTHKAGRVVVPDGFGVSKRLHGRIGLDDLILQSPLEDKQTEMLETVPGNLFIIIIIIIFAI